MVTNDAGDERLRDPYDTIRDDKARSTAKTATIIAAIAAALALIAFIVALAHNHDTAPANCDPATDYVCKPELRTETSTTEVPTTSMSPTEVPVPTMTPSETVTTTVVP